MSAPTVTPPAPGRAEGQIEEPCSEVQPDRLTSTTCKQCGYPVLVHVSRPAPAIVAEVGDIEAIRARCLRMDEREESKAGLMRDREDLLSAYDAALRTLAEVRDTLESAGVMLADSNSRLRAQLSAATQRAEQTERALAEALKSHDDPNYLRDNGRQRAPNEWRALLAALPAPATNATGEAK